MSHNPYRSWLENIIERTLEKVLTAWVERCMPCPNRVVRGRFVNPRITERTAPMEAEMQVISITAPADTPFGYDGSGIQWVNGAGAVVDPDPSTVSASSSNPDVCEDVRYLGSGNFFFNPKDSAPAGATADIVFSAAETGTQDDVTIHYTVGEDRLLGSAQGITVAERTAPL